MPSRRLALFGVAGRKRRQLTDEGWLVPVIRGVVLVGGGRPTDWQRAVAYWLVAGPGAALSHATAARIHRLVGAAALPPTPVEVTVFPPAHPQIAGCRVHRVTDVQGVDTVFYRGVRVVAAPRTLLDVAPRLSVGALARTVDEGLVTRLWTLSQLEALVAGGAGRPGVPALRRLVRARSGDPVVDSHLEQRVTRLLAFLGPFETRYQVVTGGRVVLLDLAWPDRRVAVECDGWGAHGRSRARFESDRRRDNDLIAAGWTVVHLTSAMSDDEIRAAVARVLLRSAVG